MKFFLKHSLSCLLALHLVAISFLRAESDEVITLNKEDIASYHVTTIQELLNRMPGITASDSYVKMRGSSAVKVLVDGKPINNPLSSHSAIKWGLVPFASIDQIEIYKGAGAAMFGEGTDGGAIVITRKQGGSSSTDLLLKGGNWGTASVELNNQTSFANQNLIVSYEDFRSDGYRENGDKHRYSFSFSDNLNTERFGQFTLSGGYSWEERGSPGYPEYLRLQAREASEASTASVYYTTGDSLKSNLYYRAFWSKSSDPDRNLLSEIESRSIGNQSDFHLPLPGGKHLPVGLSFESVNYEGTQLEDKTEQEAAVYSSWMTRISDFPLYLSLSARFNWYSEFDSVLDPTARLSTRKGKWRLFAAFGTGHKAPSILKRHQSTSTRIPNLDLEMELTEKWELGTSYAFSDQLNLSTSFYYKTTTDRITYTRLDDGMGQYLNIGEANWLGVESTLSGKLSERFRYSFTHSWMDARDETNDLVLTASPKHRFQGELEINPLENWKVFVTGDYRARQFSRSDNTESVSPYMTVDLRVEYRWRTTLYFLRIENLLDRDYLYGDGLPGAPTEWHLGLKFTF